MGKVVKPKIYDGIFDSLKEKLIEIVTDYFKKNAEFAKKQIFKHIERVIEKRIKRELQKIIYTALGAILAGFGAVFLIYGLISMIVALLGLQAFVTPIAFGLLLAITGLIIYLMR